MRTFLILLAVVPMVAAPSSWAGRPKYNLAREKGAVYVRDVLEEKDKIQLKVLKPTPVYMTKDAEGARGTLKAGGTVELEAFTQFALRVRGPSEQGDVVVGWVNPRDIDGPPANLLENLKKMIERRDQVDKLIAGKLVALGMTTDEVNESRGEPTKRSNRVTAEGRTDTWEYIEYEKIPQYDYVRDPTTGQIFRRIISYISVEKNKITIDFKDNVVVAVAGMEDLRRKRDLAIVPAPLPIIVP